MVFQETLELNTQKNGDMYDLTHKVSAIVKKSQIRTGIAHIFNVGSTGAIEFEPGLQQDLPNLLNKLMLPSRDYGHEWACTTGTVILICKPLY